MKFLAAVACLFSMFLNAASVHASDITLSPDATHALDQIYSGDPADAIATARAIEQSQPESPVGFLLEAEADWWKMYCAACGVKWGMLDAAKRGKQPEDDDYLALADKAIALSRAQLAKSETAEAHVYVAAGFALKARLYGLRDERRNVARAAVAARSECLRALQLDPDMADATAALGLYNYYVDTLSAIAKILRFFMGIPGGSKEEGIRQMRVGMEHGALLAVNTRFYLARNLRTFDERYADALAVAEPLVARYPRNPVFQLLAGNLNVELGRSAKASEYFRAVLAMSDSNQDPACFARARELANSFLASLQ
jgi:tetratricopeptide (TPR) repeat protein